MEEIKKIIAKAAYGQGTKSFSKDIHINTIEGKKPTEILGIIITDAEILSCALEGNIKNGKAVRIKGKFDVHLWYALSEDTKVTKVSTKFSDILIVSGQEAEKYNNEEVRAWIQKTPQYSGTSMIDGPEGPGVTVTVLYELGAEILGQTTLSVKVINTVDASEDAPEVLMDNGEILDEYEDD
ncbi:MAG: outer spore coat protein CotE [Eubacteriales bacterium]|nr:outer spore coat protein CotE [Eubacteriales bacterium]